MTPDPDPLSELRGQIAAAQAAAERVAAQAAAALGAQEPAAGGTGTGAGSRGGAGPDAGTGPSAGAGPSADAAPGAGAGAGAGAGRIPPAGWATPEDGSAREDELRAIATLVGTLRELVPPELEEQVRELLRQVLLLLRAVIDWWVARMDAPAPPRGGVSRAAGPAVQEIRID